MFFAGASGVLSNVAFENLAFYGNSAENKLTIGSPAYDNTNVSAIYFASYNDEEGVTVDGLRVLSGRFSRDVLIDGNTFYDNRKADNNRDHSTGCDGKVHPTMYTVLCVSQKKYLMCYGIGSFHCCHIVFHLP